MARNWFTTEKVIHKLRKAEVIIAKGNKAPEACHQIGVTEQALYRWSKEHGGLRSPRQRNRAIASRERPAILQSPLRSCALLLTQRIREP